MKYHNKDHYEDVFSVAYGPAGFDATLSFGEDWAFHPMGLWIFL